MTRPFLGPSSHSATPPHYIVGIDVGSETCLVAVLAPDKRVVVKPFDIATTDDGFRQLEQKLAHFDCSPHEILIGLEATGRY